MRPRGDTVAVCGLEKKSAHLKRNCIRTDSCGSEATIAALRTSARQQKGGSCPSLGLPLCGCAAQQIPEDLSASEFSHLPHASFSGSLLLTSWWLRGFLSVGRGALGCSQRQLCLLGDCLAFSRSAPAALALPVCVTA